MTLGRWADLTIGEFGSAELVVTDGYIPFGRRRRFEPRFARARWRSFGEVRPRWRLSEPIAFPRRVYPLAHWTPLYVALSAEQAARLFDDVDRGYRHEVGIGYAVDRAWGLTR